jgi:hypothetical protein
MRKIQDPWGNEIEVTGLEDGWLAKYRERWEPVLAQ